MKKTKVRDCDTCAKKADCPDYESGLFCTRWCSSLPDEKRKDPEPDGWMDDE